MPKDLLSFTPSELNLFAKEWRRNHLREAQERRFETAIHCTYLVNCSSTKKGTKDVKTVYEKMRIRDPDESEEVIGERRHYKGSLKSQFEQHIAYLESKRDAGHN